MVLPIDEKFVQELAAGPGITAGDARAIARIAYLMLEADFETYPEERESMARLVSSVWDIAAREPEDIELVSPLPIDEEERRDWIRKLAAELETDAGRELAYVVAYLVATSDHQLGRVEGHLIDLLQHELGIGDDRAVQLAAAGAGAATPGVGVASDELTTSPR